MESKIQKDSRIFYVTLSVQQNWATNQCESINIHLMPVYVYVCLFDQVRLVHNYIVQKSQIFSTKTHNFICEQIRSKSACPILTIQFERNTDEV